MSFALIIEDEMIVAFSVEEALGQLGYSLFEIAMSVEHAIKAAKSRCPDLIVSDHRITGGTGTDAVLGSAPIRPSRLYSSRPADTKPGAAARSADHRKAIYAAESHERS